MNSFLGMMVFLLTVMGSKTFIINTTFDNFVGSLIIFFLQAKFPTRFLVAAFLFTIVESGDAFRIIVASSPFTGTVFHKALMRSLKS